MEVDIKKNKAHKTIRVLDRNRGAAIVLHFIIRGKVAFSGRSVSNLWESSSSVLCPPATRQWSIMQLIWTLPIFLYCLEQI